MILGSERSEQWRKVPEAPVDEIGNRGGGRGLKALFFMYRCLLQKDVVLQESFRAGQSRCSGRGSFGLRH